MSFSVQAARRIKSEDVIQQRVTSWALTRHTISIETMHYGGTYDDVPLLCSISNLRPSRKVGAIGVQP